MQLDKSRVLDSLEEDIEKHINIAISHFQNLDKVKLIKQPDNGGWSIAQCLEHLNSYGRYYLPAIENGLRKQKDNQSEGQCKSSWLGRYFTKLMNPNTGKRKFKAFKAHVPSKELNGYVVVAEFIQQQEILLGLIKDVRKKEIGKISVPISIAKIIELNLIDVFQFLIAHNERHVQQAQRNL